METLVLKIDSSRFDPEVLLPAAVALAEGKLVAFPTETVYGLGANALDPIAVGRIFKAKGRPSDNPLIVHISRIEDINQLIVSMPEKARILADAFWPGPLTMVLNKSNLVPDVITAGLSTVAVRVPDNEIALSLIGQAGVPVAAPSANLSGKPSPTDAAHVIQDLSGRIDFIIDGGNCKVGLESTVIDMTADPPVVLRPGGITAEMLEKKIGKVIADNVLEKDGDNIPKSPGMKYRHYSPKAEMTIVSGDPKKMVDAINNLLGRYKAGNLKTGVLASEETRALYDASVVLCPGSMKRPENIAAEIYSCLRKFDDEGVEIIFTEAFPEHGIGHAIMNRLKKAAGGRIIRV